MIELLRDDKGIWVDNASGVISYPEEGNSNSFALEDNSFWFRHRNNILKQIIARFPFDKNYADIGGGNGYQAKFISENFKDRKVFLIEPGYQGCMNARKRGLENVYNITFQKFDFAANGVTAVGMYDVLEHIENDVAFLKDLKNKLTKGSIIYITVPAHNYLWSDVDDYGGHYRRYSLKMLKDVSQQSGMTFLYGSYFFSYIPPLTYFLRSLPYKLKGKRETQNLLNTETEQHNPSPAVLKIFDFFHRYERKKVISSKIPVGASCIAVLKT